MSNTVPEKILLKMILNRSANVRERCFKKIKIDIKKIKSKNFIGMDTIILLHLM